jgi:hypothetical protein
VWWQWALAIPIENNPIADPTGEKAHLGQTGPVWFLAGTSGDPPIAERTCTVPANKAILFPILNVIGATPFDGETDAQVAAACRMWMDWVTEMEARVDGRALQDLGSYRFPSPIFSFTAPEAEHALFPVYAGTQTGGQSEGYWIMLEPLSPGPHTIYFRGKIVFPAVYPNVGVWETQLTYHLTVE